MIGSLALAEVLLSYAGVQPNIEVIDERTQYLANRGVDDVVSALFERARQRQLIIFYTDHQVTESARFASTITVVKDNDGAFIEE